jgi:Transcriptional Coactivator p15 (PC4)
MEIGSVQKNSQEEIRVTIQNYQGTDIIDLRTYWQNAEGSWLPTKKGISLTYYVVEDVIKLLQKAFKKMPEQSAMTEEESLSVKEMLAMIKRL